MFLAVDRTTGENRGFAFVNYVYREDADRAIRNLNGARFWGVCACACACATPCIRARAVWASVPAAIRLSIRFGSSTLSPCL